MTTIISHDIQSLTATDKIGNTYIVKRKLLWGPDGVGNDVTLATPFPVYDSAVSGAVGQLDQDLLAFKAQNHADLVSVTGWLNTIDTDLLSFKASNHVDLTQLDTDLLAFKAQNHIDLVSVTGNIKALDTDLNTFAAQNHTDLVSVTGNVHQVDLDLLAFKSANHTDLVAVTGSLAQIDTDLLSFKASNHSDLVAVTAAINQVDTDLLAFKSANHTDLTTIDTDLKSGAQKTQIVSNSGLSAAIVTAYGTLQTSGEGTNILFDDFNGTTLQPQIWAVFTSGSSTYNLNVSLLHLVTSTVASNQISISSFVSFDNLGFTWLRFGAAMQFESGALLTNTHRFWGFGTPGASLSTVNPITDGIGFEITPAGAGAAVIYASGSKVFSAAISIPTDGNLHSYVVIRRTDQVIWYLDNFDTPVATSLYINPSTTNLPARLSLLNGSTPPLSAPTFISMAVGVSTSNQDAVPIADGQFPWRKSKLDAYNALTVGFNDGPTLDPFGRLRVSTPNLLYESVFKYDKQPLEWDETTTGAGTSTFVQNLSSIQLSTTTASGDSVIRQTRLYVTYHPGRGQLIIVTGNFGGLKTNVVQEIGYFDAQNGIFFRGNSGTAQVVQRSFTSGVAVDTAVNQANWNLDRMDGTGLSGITIDFSKQQVFLIDLEWLGSGRVRLGFVVNGLITYCHQFTNANSLTVPYMTTAKLPIRYQITNTGTVASPTTMNQTCVVVISEGGGPGVGTIRSVNNGITPKSVTAGVRTPILSLRLSSSFIRASLNIINTFAINFNNANFFYEIVFNGTLTGAVFAAVPGYGEVDVAATAIAGGTTVASSYSLGTGVSISDTFNSEDLIIGATIAGVSDIVSVVVTPFANTTVAATIDYGEET